MLARFALAHSVGSGARIFVAECDPSCAQQASFEGRQVFVIFVSSTGNFNITAWTTCR